MDQSSFFDYCLTGCARNCVFVISYPFTIKNECKRAKSACLFQILSDPGAIRVQSGRESFDQSGIKAGTGFCGRTLGDQAQCVVQIEVLKATHFDLGLYQWNSLCDLCVLCASVVKSLAVLSNHRGTKNTEIAQEKVYKLPRYILRFRGLSVCVGPSHCLSYTAILLNLRPVEVVPLVVTVRVLPSAETTILPVTVTFPPFLPF